jgi:hypothetical protein
MDTKERFLTQLFERTDGRIDRTLHAYLHIAKPLRLSLTETQACVHALVEDGLIEADAMFDSLIWLTPKGVAVCRRCLATDAVVADNPSTTEPLGSLVAPYGVPAQFAAQPMHC